MGCRWRIVAGAARGAKGGAAAGVSIAAARRASDAFRASHKRILWALALGLAAAWGARAAANDSAAALGAGGLVLERAADVSMAVERLEIRRDAVRVRYTFVNPGPADVVTLVAFPLPEVSADYLEDPDFGPRPDPVNFVGFTVTVDGRRVAPRAELRAFVGGREVTGLLRQLGVPVSLFDARLRPALAALAPAASARLAAAGALNGAMPAWRLRARLYWEQRFPAGTPVAVEHRYRPIGGGAFWLARELRGRGVAGAQRPPYCLDAAARARVAALDPERAVWVGHIDYILTTGRNWAGPIRDFELIVESGDREQIATACIDGVRRVSARRIEARLADFTPARELVVGFISIPADDQRGAAPSGSEGALAAADLADLSLAQLRLMRNEIYARHGLVFSSPALRSHFAAQPWYRPQHADVSALLTDVERANIALIRERERALAP